MIKTKFGITILGELGVGKSTIFDILWGIDFVESNNIYIRSGIDSLKNEASIFGNKYIFKIYDTSGIERYRSMVLTPLKVSNEYILVFDFSKRQSMNI